MKVRVILPDGSMTFDPEDLKNTLIEPVSVIFMFFRTWCTDNVDYFSLHFTLK